MPPSDETSVLGQLYVRAEEARDCYARLVCRWTLRSKEQPHFADCARLALEQFAFFECATAFALYRMKVERARTLPLFPALAPSAHGAA